LSTPAALLNEWAENYDSHRSQVNEYYSLLPLSEIESRLAEACQQRNRQYALAVFSAADRMASFVRYQRVSAYIAGSVADIAAELDLKPGLEGTNVSLIAPCDEGVWYGMRQVDGIWVTSPIQTYLDLHSARARGEEAAEFLRKEVIEPQW
jgi:hypothetical protein